MLFFIETHYYAVGDRCSLHENQAARNDKEKKDKKRQTGWPLKSTNFLTIFFVQKKFSLNFLMKIAQETHVFLTEDKIFSQTSRNGV